ncbi:MAG: hypothetical protein EOP50_21675, partial [Sphingobacteriales bacterium]
MRHNLHKEAWVTLDSGGFAKRNCAVLNVSRTGYMEKDVVDPTTVNFKLGGALHYKITPNLEAVAMGYWGTGNTVYTGSDRYSLRDLKMGQYKLELNSTNWFVRAYT